MQLNQSNGTGNTIYQVLANANDEPKCAMLTSTGSEIMSLWFNELTDWNMRVARYRKSHPGYYPQLSKWVEPEVWLRLSEDVLDPEDRTSCGPPNDLAVEELLRGEGRYAGRQGGKETIVQANPFQKLKQLKYELKATHVQAYVHAPSPLRDTLLGLLYAS